MTKFNYNQLSLIIRLEIAIVSRGEDLEIKNRLKILISRIKKNEFMLDEFQELIIIETLEEINYLLENNCNIY